MKVKYILTLCIISLCAQNGMQAMDSSYFARNKAHILLEECRRTGKDPRDIALKLDEKEVYEILMTDPKISEAVREGYCVRRRNYPSWEKAQYEKYVFPLYYAYAADIFPLHYFLTFTPDFSFSSKLNLLYLTALIVNGADVNLEDQNGITPLHIAAEKGNIRALLMLLVNNAEVNQRDRNYQTPLHKAAAAGKADVVEPLLEYGAEFNTKDRFGRTSLDIAKGRGDKTIIEILITKAYRQANPGNREGCSVPAKMANRSEILKQARMSFAQASSYLNTIQVRSDVLKEAQSFLDKYWKQSLEYLEKNSLDISEQAFLRDIDLLKRQETAFYNGLQ